MGLQQKYQLSSTQTGSIAEALVASGLMQASGGRLTPFEPIADDHGIDLLLYDKGTGNATPLQVKCRQQADGRAGDTIQFDVRTSTFRPDQSGYLVAVLLKDLTINTLWLIPMADLPLLARTRTGKLIMVASAKPV